MYSLMNQSRNVRPSTCVVPGCVVIVAQQNKPTRRSISNTTSTFNRWVSNHLSSAVVKDVFAARVDGPAVALFHALAFEGRDSITIFNARLSLEGWVSMLFDLAIELRLVLSYLSGSDTHRPHGRLGMIRRRASLSRAFAPGSSESLRVNAGKRRDGRRPGRGRSPSTWAGRTWRRRTSRTPARGRSCSTDGPYSLGG